MTSTTVTSRRAHVVIAVGILTAAVVLLQLLLPAGTQAKQQLGNHSFVGRFSFGADGVIEQAGESTRGFWEIGSFLVDGKGNMTNGVEYSNLVSDDEATVDQPFTFTGTYDVEPNGMGKARVAVVLPNGFTIHKTVWFVLSDIRSGEAYRAQFGHLHADLGDGTHGRAGLHIGLRID